MTMPNHYIHFNRRQVREEQCLAGCQGQRETRAAETPWYAEEQEDFAGFGRPLYHVTRATTGCAAQIAPGDTIWLVAQLYTPWGKLPPALDARIDVEAVSRRRSTRGFLYTAADTSCCFSCADVTPVLHSLETQTASGRINPLVSDPAKPVGLYLRQLRRLADAESLVEWQRHLDEAAKHFISYRHCDGTRSAYRKIEELVAAGEVVYWDRWSLPRRLAERREQVSDQAVDTRIEDLIERASVVWGVETPCYAREGSYSLKEKELAKRLGKYRAVPPEDS